MRTYGKVALAFWIDEDVIDLSDRGKVLALYLLTGPHSNSVGCYRLPQGYIQADLRWDDETVTETLSELLRIGFINRCLETNLTLLPNYLRYNGLENPNVGKRAADVIDSLPRKSPVFRQFLTVLERYGKHLPNGYVNGLRNGIGNPEPEPEPEPEPKEAGAIAPDSTTGDLEGDPDNLGDIPTAQDRRVYAFKGEVVRLSKVDYEKWKQVFSNIPNIDAELTARDLWLADQSAAVQAKWFQSTSALLAKRDRECAITAAADSGERLPVI